MLASDLEASVAVAVAVAVAVGVALTVAVAVAVGVSVGLAVGVGVGVPAGRLKSIYSVVPGDVKATASDDSGGAVRVRSSHRVIRTSACENDVASVSVVTM